MSSGLGSPNSSSAACAAVNGGSPPNGPRHQHHHWQQAPSSSAACSPKGNCGGGFQMPLHYPRYKKSDYEMMPEWQLELLLNEYGLPAVGDLHQKRKFAMGAFLWPDQL